MKAIVYTQYGAPEVQQLKDVPQPVPNDNEVLVKIHATTLNRTDIGFRKPEYPVIIRPMHGLLRPKRTILGSEFAGEVAAIGKDVTLFKTGDAVFGLSTYKFGTHAEYICIAEGASIVHKPHNMSFEEAAAVCDGLMLGTNIIRMVDFATKPRVLINGATGSIGSACVQLAKYYGAHITAVCKGEHTALVKALGADEVIDYTSADFTKGTEPYDAVLDAVGKSSYFKCKSILKPQGLYISTELGYMAQNVFLTLAKPLLGGKKVAFPIPTDSKKDILFYKELIEGGHYKAVIDRTYPLTDIVAATKYVETGEKIGNVVLRVV